MTVLISPVYTGITANDGTGDQIKTAFDKVNTSLSNVVTAVNNIQSTYANTTYGVFGNVAITNRVRSDLYLDPGYSLYVYSGGSYSPVALSAASFTGGNVASQTNFQATTSSTSSTTGAVVITGGLGVRGNINTANAISTTGILTVSNGTDSSSTATGGIVTSGGIGVTKNAYIGGGLYVTGIVSGAALTATGASTFTDSTVSTGYSSGALLVTGGVGVGGNLNVNGLLSNFYNDVSITGNLSVSGNVNTGSQSLSISGPVINIQTFANLAPLTVDNGYDVGLSFHTYKAGGVGDSHAFLGWDNASGNLKYFSTGAVPNGSGVYSGTAGSAAFGAYYAVNTTPSTSTTTGALQVAGGAGIAGNIYVGANAVVTGNATVGNITTNGKMTGVTGNITTLNSLFPSFGSVTPLANVTYNIGSTSNYWNNIYGINFVGTSTSAKYADLAEKYLPDADYAVGTVVCVGGTAEITASTFGRRAIGAVSGNPAYKMNSDLEGGVYVALKGRVPVQVIGTVKKGDNLIAADNGCASAAVYHSSEVFAVALDSSDDTGVKLIEAIIL